MSTTKQNKRNRKIAAIALVAVGVAGLGAASASQLTVTATDGVASGSSATVGGITGAAATVRTVRADALAPAANGSVPVDLEIALTGAMAGATGTVYVGSQSVPIAALAAADEVVTVPGTTFTTALTSHSTLGPVSIVLVAPAT